MYQILSDNTKQLELALKNVYIVTDRPWV